MFPEFRKHGNIRSLFADKAIHLQSAIFVDLPKLGTDSGDKLLFPLQTAVAGLAGDSSTKTRLAQRLPPVRGYGLQRCASTWRPCAPRRAETDDRWDLSHVQLHDWPYFHRTFNLKDRAALGKLHPLVQITGFDQRVAADNVLGLGKRPVGHCLLLAFD